MVVSKSSRSRLVAILALAVLVAGIAASAVIPVLPSARAATTWHVYAVNYQFLPADITIQPGDTIIWTNNVSTEHSVTSTSSPAAWTEILLTTAGSTGQHTFNTPGVYPYQCKFHYFDGMTGQVTVQGTIPEFSSTLAIVGSWIALAAVFVVARRRR